MLSESKQFQRKYQQVRYGKEINCATVTRGFLMLKIRERYAASERSFAFCFLLMPLEDKSLEERSPERRR